MATLVGSPIDVVKTRVMAARKAQELKLAPAAAPTVSVAGAGSGAASIAAAATPIYTGAFDCIAKTLRNEGPLAFYKGVAPQFVRITGWNIVMFVSMEKLKSLAASWHTSR